MDCRVPGLRRDWLSPGNDESGDEPCYKRDVRQDREAQAMTDMTYDRQADAVYIAVGRGEIARQEEAGPFIYDVDAQGRVIGIEVLSASKVLAPGDWQRARRPDPAKAGAAE